MDCSKSEKAYTAVGCWLCSRKVLKMSTAGKAYTTVGSWWRKADNGNEFHAAQADLGCVVGSLGEGLDFELVS